MSPLPPIDVESAPTVPLTLIKSGARPWSVWQLIGPGLLVCLADTDAGCLIVAAQSGVRWGYSLLPLQVLLIPVLYATQELTIRLAVHTQQGLTSCIRKKFGNKWALFTCFLLLVECTFAMVSEMSGIASVAELWGVDRGVATLMAAGMIGGIVVSCNYRQIEAIGVAFGLFELVFVFTMFAYRPNLMEVIRGSFEYHQSPEYTQLVAANIGAVIMPWMIYFQQSACVARRIVTKDEMEQEKVHTMVGSILTQMVMIGALVTLAAARSSVKDLETVHDIVRALEPVLGETTAKLMLSAAFLGGSMCASFVVSLAASWAVAEALERDDQFSLDRSPTEAPLFYGSFFAVLLLGGAILFSGINIVRLNIFVELVDSLLLPFAVGFVFLLSSSELLPQEARLSGWYKDVLRIVFSVVAFVGVSCGIHGLVMG